MKTVPAWVNEITLMKHLDIVLKIVSMIGIFKIPIAKIN